ncbi:unnamed protein product, partial [marine sediment metagenome]
QKTSLSDQVISTLPPPPVAEDMKLPGDDGSGSASTNLEEVDPPTVAAGTPLRLKRVPTREEAFVEFWQHLAIQSKQWRHKVTASFFKGIEPFVARVSEVEGREALWHVGFEAVRSGDLETGQVYLREAYEGYVNASGRLHRWHDERIASTAMHLAWLEDDPEVAVRLLEKACAVESPFQTGRVVQAARLAAVTGSEELRDYYVERLRKVNPEMARAFDR